MCCHNLLPALEKEKYQSADAEYEIPELDGQRGLTCAVLLCRAGACSRWWHTANARTDPRRVCERCVTAHPDLRIQFNEPIGTAKPAAMPARKAATRLQAAIRKFVRARKRAAAAEQAQAQVRRLTAKTMHDERRAAITELQVGLRGAMARSRHQQARAAAMCIQRAWRHTKAQRTRAHAARRIQALQRGRSTRARLLRHIEQSRAVMRIMHACLVVASSS